MAIGHARQSLKLLFDSGWSGRVLGNVAGIVMIVGAAGGLQRLCQETGMAELLGERLLAWPAGLLVPFLIAAVMKSLQGSSLVAAIATAGMVQPLLTPLGIGDENGRALATLAVGAGAMTVSHINDEYFWLVAAGGGLSPVAGAGRCHRRHADAGRRRRGGVDDFGGADRRHVNALIIRHFHVKVALGKDSVNNNATIA